MKRIGTSYLEFLTDDFGIWQHSDGQEIDRTQGYALDDSARALLAAVELGRTDLATVYISFIERACSGEGAVNFYTAERQPWDRPWSPDALAECYWALAYAISHDVEAARCRRIIAGAIYPRLYELRQWLRASSYLLIGAVLIDQPLAEQVTEELLSQFRPHLGSSWPWPEQTITYANAMLPMALLEAQRLLGIDEAGEAGVEVLHFLNSICLLPNHVQLIGNDGWYPKGGTCALFGQQPIEAGYSCLACLSAYSVTNNPEWRDIAGRYLGWFWGSNSAGEPLINAQRESVADGIDAAPRGISPNAGSENIVCYLLAQERYFKSL